MAPASLCQDPRACVSVVCVLLFKFVSFSWRMIAFQCPAGFCPTSAWISHRPSWSSSHPPRSGRHLDQVALPASHGTLPAARCVPAATHVSLLFSPRVPASFPASTGLLSAPPLLPRKPAHRM